jgi:elongation factor Ts
MKVSLDAIKSLREKTRASLNDVREALASANGDETKALEWLRKRGAQVAEKRQGRATDQGRVEAYLHHDGRLAALVEVNCETDFVARTPEFISFCRDLAMQVAAMSPQYVRQEDVPAGADPATLCLLQQPFVKDASTTIGSLLTALIAKTGENVVIRRFSRFALGEAA